MGYKHYSTQLKMVLPQFDCFLKFFMVAILAMEQLAKDKRVSIDHEGRNSEGMMMLLLS
jgi:hypothetical protein